MKPVTEKDLRGVLDIIEMNDSCNGWRNMSQIIDALRADNRNDISYKKKITYWLQNYNRDDQFFESRIIDGEWCYRSHKFDLCHDRFMETIANYKMKVLRYPEKVKDLQLELNLCLRAALQPPAYQRKRNRLAVI
ncbi:hypothetical protein [Synechococcus sp. ROS8604]|uniref:hypothetical protein n=1 Tax=Synechococcus sp. ROS8604 TaxID=1442557 RepID=UPI001647ADCD|nr:hypothetical protein [Synechococcus sp. ROS8604]QNI88856.1 hypothetical protein SynROS8604_02226 [Synechococcus sp. ROS8604]